MFICIHVLFFLLYSILLSRESAISIKNKCLHIVNIVNEFELNICRDIIFPKTNHIINIFFLQDY